MKEQNLTQHPIVEGEEWISDEPAFGYYPDQAFNASYKLNGQKFPVVIQGFVRKDAPPLNNFRYRVTYNSDEEKILEYVLGIGFTEEGRSQTDHAKRLGACIEKHFSEEPISFS